MIRIMKNIFAIEGNISSGKSTILNYLLNKHGPKMKLVEEPVEEWNQMNLLKLFYEEKERWSFTFENFVQLCRVRGHMACLNEAKLNKNKCIVMERSLWSSLHVFTKNTYEDKGISKAEYDVLKSYFNLFSEKLLKESSCDLLPFKIIYIKTDPSVCYERLKIRNREAENTVSLEYLTKIHVNYENWINNLIKQNPSLVTVIDGNLDKMNVCRLIDKSILFDNYIDEKNNVNIENNNLCINV